MNVELRFHWTDGDVSAYIQEKQGTIGPMPERVEIQSISFDFQTQDWVVRGKSLEVESLRQPRLSHV